MNRMNNNIPNVGNSNFNIGSSNMNDNYKSHIEPRLGEYYDRQKRFNVSEINNQSYNSNNYENVFSVANNVRTDGQENLKYKKRDNYMVISSKDRDLSLYTKSCQFVLDLDNEYKNIISVELIQAIIPDKNNVTSEPFLLLNIKELEPVMESNNKEIYDSFAMLQICAPTVAGSFLQIDKRIFESVILEYRTPKAKLSRLSLSITDCDGNLFEFGGDNTITKDYQCQFVFKITTLDTDRNIINQRNVY